MGMNGSLALTASNMMDESNPGVFLAHKDIPADDSVWHDQESVVNGEDAVVNKAIDWITNVSYLREPMITKGNEIPLTDTVTVMVRLVNPTKSPLRIHGLINNLY